jgi:hypothetical protein
MTKKKEEPRLVLEYWAIEKLMPYIRNPRKNDHQVEKMVGSLTEFDFALPILVTPKGEVVDGHLRLKGAQAAGMKEVPVVIKDGWTEAQIKAFRLLANRSANWADWDYELLVLEVKELEDMGFDKHKTGFDDSEFERMMNNSWHSDIDVVDKHGAHTDGIEGRVVIRCAHECVDLIKEELVELFREKGIDAQISG